MAKPWAMLGVPLWLVGVGCSCGEEDPSGDGVADSGPGADGGGEDAGDHADGGGADGGQDAGLDAGDRASCGDGVLEPGDFCFPSAILLDVGEDPRAVETADFDGDGETDLAVAHGDPAAVTVLAGDGTGRFDVSTTFDLTPFLEAWQGPLDLAVADVDEDGAIDVVAPVGDVIVLPGTGTGELEDPLVTTAGTVISVAVADLDADGHLDLLTGSRDAVQPFLGDGTGVFAAGTALELDDPYRPAAADLDADGILDLVVGIGSTGSSFGLSVHLGDGAGGFSAGTRLPTVEHPDRVVPADLDGDGDLDLAAYYSDSDIVFIEPLDGLIVFLGEGDGGFEPAAPAFAGDTLEPVHLSRLGVMDLDADGVLDLVTANGGTGDVGVYRGDGAGGFPWEDVARFLVGGADALSSAPAGPLDVAGADFDRDGDVDLATVGASAAGAPAGTLAILRADGSGRFAAPSSIGWVPGLALVSSGDFDADGSVDLAFYNFFCAGIAGCFQVVGVALQTDGRFTMQGVDAGGALSRLHAARMDDDDVLDLVGLSWSSVSVFRGDGTGALSEATPVEVGTGASDLAVADLDGDGHLDVATANAGSGDVSVLLGDAAGTLRAIASVPVGEEPRSIAAGDFDRDGSMDLVVAHAAGVAVLSGDGAGGFAPGETVAVAAATDLDATDLDLDGHVDLVVADSAATRVFFGDGSGDFPDSVDLGVAAREIVAADLDQDGSLDLLLPESGGRVALVRNEGGRSFEVREDYLAGKGAEPTVLVTVRDFDGDGAPDLAFADRGAGSLRMAYATP